jgi:hypothetical protein
MKSSLCIRAAVILVCVGTVFCATSPAQSLDKPKPRFRDFMGINGHTVLFRPELYRETAERVRDYHPMDWDTGAETDYPLDFPFARNRVDWKHVYGSWKQEGFKTDACIMFDSMDPTKWKDIRKDAQAYGRKFAESFGPRSPLAVVESVEIGNEPGKYSDELYRAIFESMAKGFREGDPTLKIATCNVNAAPSGGYHKSVECVAGLEAAYDVLNIHTYAMLEEWPTWKRSFPEDTRLPKYLKDVDDLIQWRNEHAPGKEVWITEFGWDASTKQPPAEGDFAKWQGNTDLQQAQWLVRSFFVFASRDVDRAYLYFFNDSDEPKLHAASGLTRNFVPKASYYAVRHLYKTLGDYRFNRVVMNETGKASVFEFLHADDPRKLIWAAWSPTGDGLSSQVKLPLGDFAVERIESMPTSGGDPDSVQSDRKDNTLVISVDESPAYIHLKK